ncbi:MAG: hypothetical protein K1X75_07065 [Leptospirales bacterium]|nr:hypothetical protein [Leptospirales bacterium]
MLQFESGNPEKPSGNLLVYCEVRGENPIEPEDGVLACHIAVSFVGAQESNFPVVIFPPISAADLSELETLAARDDRLDIVRTEDYIAPAEEEREDYMRRRMEQLNELVLAYVELCRKRFAAGAPPSGRRLRALPSPPSAPEPQTPNSESRLFEEMEQALSGSGDSASRDRLDSLLRHAMQRFPQFDTGNLLRDLKAGGLDLARLYLKKFRAIQAERYEEAASLQSDIQKFVSR